MHFSMGGGAPDHRASAHEATHADARFFRVSHARARTQPLTLTLAAQFTPGPCAPFLRACAAHAHTTTTKNDAATPACHRPMANAKKAAAMSEHVFTAEVVSVTTLATAPR